ncbi:MAG: hypothetical protein NTY07_06440 [Bacteroidia bacterium]|nr:hypothetical protein [Bacteroidia bacterium]
MSQKDLMKDWFKELPSEQPSPDFKVKVMQRVMSEWTLNPIKYQPIISRKGWWSMVLIAILMTSILFMLHSSFPTGTESASQAKTVYGLDLSQLILPVSHFFEKLNNISPAVAIGALAIIALWFFDQLFVKTVKR